MDWKLCIVCQQDTHEVLRCPLNAEGGDDKSKVYASFLINVSEFKKLNQLPVALKFGEDIDVEQLVTHQVKWHKSCHLKFNDTKLQRARKRESNEKIGNGTAIKRSRLQRQSLDKTKCIFCSNNDGHLHEFRTFDADDNVRRMAIDLQDTALITRIDGGDLTALEAKYHLSCLTALRNRHRSFLRQKSSSSNGEEGKIEARAFVELITYVENSIESGTFCFKFSLLRQIYANRLHDLGIDKEINKVRFKDKVLNYFTNAQEQNDGKNVILVFEQGMQQLLKTSAECSNYQEDALTLMKAAKIVRNEIFSSSEFMFNGSFPHGCQQQSVPKSLSLLINLLLKGGDIMDQDSTDSQPCLTVAQLIVFNIKRIATGKKEASSSKSRHSLSHEPPMPLYLGLNIHTQTRSKKLIMELSELGLSVSYNRVLQLENQIAFSVCEDFKNKGVVCPSQLRKGLFTVGALDNLDHNPSSTTAKDSFHGTGTKLTVLLQLIYCFLILLGISLFQHPTGSNMGCFQEKPILVPIKETEKYNLPDDYAIVPAVALKKEKISIPEPPNIITTIKGNISEAITQEKSWLDHAMMLMEKEQVEDSDVIAWSAYHATQESVSADVQPALTQLMPIFHEKAATAAMIKHGMDMLKRATHFLNPEEILVISLDAPLFALAKFVQWNWSQTHGEKNFVVMFGGLHIEMAMWKTFGDYLESSGWTNALIQTGIASSGTADSFLKASHLTRTRHAHQLSALALSKLQHEAFLQSEGPHNDSTKEVWRQAAITKSPTFQFWDTILRMEILGLIFVRAHREKKFSLYVESLKNVVPWFFAFDHHNYARWIPVHIRDMESLPTSVYEQFEERGHWVVQKTTNRFSAMPIDQCHEQNNEIVKGSGGAIGLTENPSAFKKWMTAGPEQARLLKEFETEFMRESPGKQLHHEEGLWMQKAFKNQTQSLVDTFNEMGNPFLHDSADLLVLDTHDVIDDSVVTTVRCVQKLGIDQYNLYHESVIKNRTTSIHEAIKKNSLPTFSHPSPKIKSKQAERISTLKHDVDLFSRLYIVTQHREGDMTTFFKHENHPYPPSLSDRGKIRQGKKSDLLSVLPTETEMEPPVTFDVKVLDGAVIVHLLSTNGVSTFDNYASQVFIPYINKQLETSK